MNMPKLLIVSVLFLACFSSFAETLQNFISKVKSKNLDLSVQSSLISAAEARSKGLALKAPMVGVSQMRNLEGVSYAFEVQQEIPLSSRLSNDRKSREHGYELQKKESDYFSVEKILEARLAFVSYWKSFEKLKYTREVRDWLKQHAGYVSSVVRSDSATNVYALEIQSFIGILENEVSTIQSNLESEKLKLRELSFDENYEPGVPALDDPRDLPEASLTSRISSINLSKLKVASSNLDVAKSSYLPNLFLRARKLDRPMIGMANQEIMVGIDLPFAFFWQPRAANADATASKYMAEADYRRSEVQSEALKQSLKAKAAILKVQMKTLREVSIPAAEKGLKYAKNIAPRDMSGLETHRRVFQDYIELKSQLLEIRMAYEEIYSNWSLIFAQGNFYEN